MQKFVLALVVGAFFVAATGCGSSTKDAKTEDRIETGKSDRPVPPQAPPYPKAVVEELVHDFNLMEAGTVGKHSFVIKNDGDFPLELAKGPTTCKCTMNNLNKQTLKKGESTTIDLEWTPPNESPDFQQTAEIWTNDPERQTINFVVKGRVVKIAEVEPSRIWSFGLVEGNVEREVSGVIKSGILEKFEIEGVFSTEDDLAIAHRPLNKEELAEHKAKSGYRITAKLKPKSVIGSFSKRLTIKTTIHKDKDREGESYVLDLVGTRSGPILIRSSDVIWDQQAMQMDLKTFNSSQEKKASLLLYVGGLEDDQELEIKKISSDPEFIQVKLESMEEPEIKPAKSSKKKKGSRRKSYRLVFVFPAGSPPVARTRMHPATVKLSTNHPGAKEMTFSILFRSN